MIKHAFLLCGALAVCGPVLAQREAPTRQERRDSRREQIQNMTPEERHQFFENRFNERLKTATPEERERMLAFRADIQQKMKDAGIDANDPNAWQKMRDAGLLQNMGNRGNRAADDAMRQMMIAAGITDKEVQDAVIAYVKEQNQARAGLFQLAQTAAQALQTPLILPIDQAPVDVEAVNAKVATTFDAYQSAAAAETARQKVALKALDEKINYSGTPRLKSFLTLVGILDNDVLAIGGPAALFASPQDGANPVPVADNGAEQGGQGWGGQGGQGRGRNRNADNGEQPAAQEAQAPAEPVASKPVRVINR